jgi:DNA-binding response OmpR family regulator
MVKTLVVDDDPDVVEAISLILKKEGHQVFQAFSGAEGKEAVKKSKPDLLILDVIMEEPDAGFSLANDLRREGFKKPIILLSSIGKVTGMEFGDDANESPDYYFVDKPIKPQALISKIKEVLA